MAKNLYFPVAVVVIFILNINAVIFGQCSVGTFECHGRSSCLPLKYVCDGDDDCGDGEDEAHCSTQSGCGDDRDQHSTSGFISSMDYPVSYSNKASCSWHISTQGAGNITFEFIDVFDLEKSRHGQCVYDSVAIFSGNPLMIVGRYCGNTKPTSVIIPGSEAVVEFKSDDQTTGRGFKIKWTSQTGPTTVGSSTRTTTKTTDPPCYITLTGNTGVISSPGFVEGYPYPAPYHCQWSINVASDYLIAMDFSDFNVGTFIATKCRYAWVKLYDGPDSSHPLIGQFCDTILPGELLSTSSSVFLEFVAENNDKNELGFRLTYVAFSKPQIGKTTLGPPPQGCDGTPIKLDLASGFLTSPNFDQKNVYGINLDCEWIITGAPGQVLYLKFVTFDIEQSRNCNDYDFLSISEMVNPEWPVNKTLSSLLRISNDNNTSDDSKLRLINKLCGIMLPYDIVSTSNKVVIKFHTDDQVSGYGFNMSFISKPPPKKCDGDTFLCGNQCLARSLVCDGVTQCSDGSDEIACPLSGSCGVSVIRPSLTDDRIVGGQEAVDGAWPWTLSVLDGTRHICGATLISPHWALGAAHCFDNIYDRKYDRFSLMAARHHTGVHSRNEQKRQVEGIIIPHTYISSTSFHDIALIKLKQSFNITEHVRTACLPEKVLPFGTKCYVTGWGSTYGTCCKDLLKQGAVPLMNTSICSQPDYYGTRIKEGMMCAGFSDGGTDACDGDSGGPLVCRTTGQQDIWELHGITSWGVFCGYPKNPGVYTRVHDFLPWIQQAIALYNINAN